MELKAQQSPSGKFTIAAFDQRASLAKMLGVDPQSDAGKTAISELKTVFMETFSPLCSAVLVDPDFGIPSLERRAPSTGLLMSLEQSAYTVEDKDGVPLLNPEWTVGDIAKYNAAVKFVLYYNPQSGNAAAKRELVAQIHADAQRANVPFLFEVILHPMPQQTEGEFAEHHPAMQLQTIADFTQHCDVLKLEFPLLPIEALDEALAPKACAAISATATVPWIILSKGMSFERFVRVLELAMNAGADGFAVGRAVWKEIGDLPTTKEQYEFIRTTAKERMIALAQIVEGS